jgi:uncharacterized membrane-anchored protein YitT (DUF2179 family)
MAACDRDFHAAGESDTYFAIVWLPLVNLPFIALGFRQIGRHSRCAARWPFLD